MFYNLKEEEYKSVKDALLNFDHANYKTFP